MIWFGDDTGSFYILHRLYTEMTELFKDDSEYNLEITQYTQESR